MASEQPSESYRRLMADARRFKTRGKWNGKEWRNRSKDIERYQIGHVEYMKIAIETE